jgi:hypothetical protein
VHGVDAAGETVVRRVLRRARVVVYFAQLPPCLAMELQPRGRVS